MRIGYGRIAWMAAAGCLLACGFAGAQESAGTAPRVMAILRTGDAVTTETRVSFKVLFSELVTGVDKADFVCDARGAEEAKPAVVSVAGEGDSYIVTIEAGKFDSISIDLLDNDSIRGEAGTPLGGKGAGNGDFSTGATYLYDVWPPEVRAVTRLDEFPSEGGAVHFQVLFSESVSGVEANDFELRGQGVRGGAVLEVAGERDVYQVTVETGVGAGTLRLAVLDDDGILDAAGLPLGGAGADNGVFDAGESYRITSPANTHFVFEKKGVLIPTPEGMPEPGPYYTDLVDMEAVAGFPYDYALYFSTDHASGAGGIWLYVCNGIPTEAANWKSYDQAAANGDFDYLDEKPAKNPIFADRVQGRQTETPCVNVIDGKLFMTYHNAGAGHGQSTLLATSPDGVNFARINGQEDSIILDYDPGMEPGDGHTGYFRWRANPFPKVDYAYTGYSLHGGGDNFFGAMWGSNDAIHWDKIQIFDAIEGYAVEGEAIVRRRSIDPNSITPLGNGEFVALCSLGHRASGTVKRRLQLYEVFLGEDGRTLTRECRKVLGNGPADALDAEELGQPTTAVIDGTWHLIYVGTRAGAGKNTIMCATGTLDLSAPGSEKLEADELQRDFHKP